MKIMKIIAVITLLLLTSEIWAENSIYLFGLNEEEEKSNIYEINNSEQNSLNNVYIVDFYNKSYCNFPIKKKRVRRQPLTIREPDG